MNKKITVTLNGAKILASAGVTLSEIIKGERPCGGHGRCGKCRVIARGELSTATDTERALLTEEELSRGVRLACLTYAIGDCEVISTQREDMQIVTDAPMSEFDLKPDFKGYGVAIDIGTTTLAARFYSSDGELISEASGVNPQNEYGADVISRVEASLNGKAGELAGAIRKSVDGIISELAKNASVNTKDIDSVVITGNTLMLALLTEQSAEPFSHAPFDVKCLFGETVSAEQLGLTALTPDTAVYLPHCISAFVGADTTCAIVATRLCEGNTALLADIGTNGEMALWHKGKLTVCSTAAGPAFEGVGITMGMRGADGAIDRVFSEDGALKVHIIGDAEPKGLCGSGLVDAVACLLDLGIADHSGYMEDDFTLKAPVVITPSDIRMLQLAKSAVCAGIMTLTEAEGVTSADISDFYIAGGFGNYLNMENAARIGLIPAELSRKAMTVGNAALAGASMMLLNSDFKARASALAKTSLPLDLASSTVFSEHFVSGMMLEEQ